MDVRDSNVDQSSIDEAYRDLVSLARAIAGSHGGLELQPNALVHEAWLRMEKPLPPDEGHREQLLTAASRVMRQVLVEELRTKRTEETLPLGAALSAVAGEHQIDADDLEDALKRLHRQDCRLARTVELRFFSGLSNAEIGHTLGVSAKTVQRDWAIARAWLRRDLIEGR